MRRVAPGQEGAAERWYQHLHRAYTANGRHYHDIKHIEHLLGLVEEHQTRLADPDAVRLAVWFHDAVHNVLRGDNERRSAALATEALTELGLKPERVQRIHGWIVATDHQSAVSGAEADLDFLLDIDLSALASQRIDYERYAQQIRQEYRIFPRFIYNRGRRKVLKALLHKPFLYRTPWLRETWESPARQNLQWELEAL